MIEKMSPDNVQLAIIRLESQLPGLVGAERWQDLNDTLTHLVDQLRQSTDDAQKRSLALRLLRLFQPHTNAVQHFLNEIETVAYLRNTLETEILDVIPDLLKDDYIVPDITFTAAKIIPTNNERLITGLEEDNTGIVKSRKLQNIQSVEQILDIVAEVVIGGTSIILAQNPTQITIALVAVLVIVRHIFKTITIPITSIQASVLFGVIRAKDKNPNKIAVESEVFKFTNESREKFNQPLLTLDQIKDSLRELEVIHAIERTSRNNYKEWRLTEHVL